MTVWRSALSSAPADTRPIHCSKLAEARQPGREPMPSATTGGAVSSHLPVRQEWLDPRPEKIIEPHLPLVDPHHHLVDPPQTGRDFPPQPPPPPAARHQHTP